MLLADERAISLREQEEPFLPQEKLPKSNTWRNYVLVLVLTISLVVNFSLLLQRNLDSTCLKKTSEYASPIIDAVAIGYKTVQFDGSFWNSSIYRQAPSPAVDQAWIDLGATDRYLIISEGQGSRYGLEAGALKRSDKDGGGYVAEIEVNHHLHCLNMLRKSLWFNYPYYQELGSMEFNATDDMLIHHTMAHCVNIIRQFIMCNADIGVFGSYWIKDVGARPNFNTRHKCRDFEAIDAWTSACQVETPRVKLREGDILLETWS